MPQLLAAGLEVVSVHEPLSSFEADVAATKRAIERAPGSVILVGHSYGGAVISEAGNDAKVSALVYVAAFAPDSHESINDLGRDQPPPAWLGALQVDTGGFGWLPADTIRSDFAQDLCASEQALLAVKQGPIAVASFDAAPSHAAWHDKPSWYVIANEDHMIDPHAQAFMAERMAAKTSNVDSSHVVMLSHPDPVARAILAAAH